jgi:D-alanyl-lipoteichoic acid acyltransferase DltB (MBOAT superfamily)
MQFNSLEYLVFLPLVVAAHFVLPHRFRWMLLLAASYYFYMSWKPAYAILMAASTLVDYVAAIAMAGQPASRSRRWYLWLSLAANLGFLGSFKYWNFINDSVRAALDPIGVLYDVPQLPWLLPVGISFYTFQSLSYTIDVYRGDIQPERHLGRFALYVSFFPQLVAGPIERSTKLLPQFRKRHVWQEARVISGAQLIIWGLFKKIVIADPVGAYVTAVYESPGSFEGLPLVIATYFFAIQIYCDFSAYSDIAIGSARILGYDLMENFRRPYLATSVADFWRRWHISLSTWFRDYVYVPLGGSRVGDGRWAVNIMLVFLASGLWHGANWTFVAWGALHGVYILVGRMTLPVRRQVVLWAGIDRWPRLRTALQVASTFHLVLVGWILFRANSFGDALIVLTNMWRIGPLDLSAPAINVAPGMGREQIIIAALAIAALMWVELLGERGRPFPRLIATTRPPIRWAVYVCLVLSILNLGLPHEVPFIYFQF